MSITVSDEQLALIAKMAIARANEFDDMKEVQNVVLGQAITGIDEKLKRLAQYEELGELDELRKLQEPAKKRK